MTYPRWLGIAAATAIALFAGCSTPDRPYGGNSSSSSSSGGTDPICSNGVKEGAEQCDGSDLGGASCGSLMGAGYFLPVGKTFVCKNDCTIDTSACTHACILDDPGSQLDSCVLQ